MVVTVKQTWATAKFGDLYLEPSRNGLNRPTRVRGSGYKMVNMREIFAFDRISDQEMERVPMNETERDKSMLRWGDLLFARQSLVAEGTGKCSIVLKASEPTTFESHLIRVRLNQENAWPPFYYYYFSSPVGKGNVQSLVMQVAAAGIRASELVHLTVPRPPLPSQRKIASILSAYDDLIENNTRRINVLEEMAQLIYREWFENFRFPGHENVKMVDSELGKIPEGWEIRTMGEACGRVIDGDWIETKDQGGQDYRLLQVSNIGIGQFVETDNYRYITQETFARLRCQEVVPEDILISRMPKPTGRAWLVTPQPWQMITAVDVAIARADGRVANTYWLLHLLNSSEQIAQVEKRTTGTTRPRISRSTLSSIPVLFPTLALQNKFGEFAKASYNLADRLHKLNANLRRTRDLLLPKLISGEVDVENLDIDIGGLGDE